MEVGLSRQVDDAWPISGGRHYKQVTTLKLVAARELLEVLLRLRPFARNLQSQASPQTFLRAGGDTVRYVLRACSQNITRNEFDHRPPDHPW